MSHFQSPNRMADKSLPRPDQCTYSRSHQPLCCTAAANRFLPHYVTHMWMATYDNGLAAVHYGPCRVSALAGDGCGAFRSTVGLITPSTSPSK